MSKKYYKEYNKEYQRSRYYDLKSRGICTKCGCNDAYAGITVCLECKMKAREAKKRYYESHLQERREKQRKWSAERRERLKVQNICISCGKRKAEKGGICKQCNARKRKLYPKYKLLECQKLGKDYIPRILFGNGEFCVTCGKRVCEGKKQCRSCYEKSVKSLEKARSVQAEKCEEAGGKKPFWQW